MALPKLLTSPHLNFSLRHMVPFLSQVSTCALGGLKGPGTLLQSGPGCDCCAQPAFYPTWVPGLLKVVLCFVKCSEWKHWAWIKIKFLRVGNVGVLSQ